jgi:hypothetical protein
MCNCIEKERAGLNDALSKKIGIEIDVVSSHFDHVGIGPGGVTIIGTPFTISYYPKGKTGKAKTFTTNIIPLYCVFCGKKINIPKKKP